MLYCICFPPLLFLLPVSFGPGEANYDLPRERANHLFPHNRHGHPP
jgi:hypothetical protein